MIIIIGVIFLIIILTVIAKINPNNKDENLKFQKNSFQKDETDYTKFTTKSYVMTQTELIFYRELKKITEPLQLSIFPQIDLERIIQIKDNDFGYRNRIKSRSIDYTVVSNKNCKIVCCIELDDYSHNNEKARKNDEFKDNIFNAVNIPLYRIKVNNYYNLQELKTKLQELLNIKY